jgi:hypothetical protein
MSKFAVGERAKIVRLLDDITNRDLIGLVGTIEEVEPLPNGDTNYYLDGHYVHEEELEAVE